MPGIGGGNMLRVEFVFCWAEALKGMVVGLVAGLIFCALYERLRPRRG